jgi:DNA-binding MarR family transcriptional regulator
VTLLNPLEAEGLVSRERDPSDRRRHVVTLTPAGKRRLDDATQAQRKVEDELFAGLEDGQREQLRDVLIALRQSLASGCPSADAPPDC